MAIKKIVTVLVAVAVVVGGVAIVGSSLSSGVFSLTLQQVLESPGDLDSRVFKVVGNVVPGSIKQGATPFELDFAISDKGGRQLDCHFKGAVPDPFAEEREVILQGRLSKEAGSSEEPTMEVALITVKCPSKYEEAGINADEYQYYYNKKYQGGHQKE